MAAHIPVHSFENCKNVINNNIHYARRPYDWSLTTLSELQSDCSNWRVDRAERELNVDDDAADADADGDAAASDCAAPAARRICTLDLSAVGERTCARGLMSFDGIVRDTRNCERL
jgi:hypothetical protein